MSETPAYLPSGRFLPLRLIAVAYVRRPLLLFATATLPVLLGWLTVTWIRISVLGEVRVVDGGIVRSWGDEPIPFFLDGLLLFTNGVGLPCAVGLTCAVWVGRILGRRVLLHTALARLFAQAPRMLLWGFAVLLVCWGPFTTVDAFLTLTGANPPREEYGPIRLLIVMAAGIVLPFFAVRFGFAVPFCLWEDLTFQEATDRVKEAAADRWPELFLCFLAAVGLLALPGVAAARVATLFTGAGASLGAGLLVQGFLLCLVAPLSVLLLCVPILVSPNARDRGRGLLDLNAYVLHWSFPAARALSERLRPAERIADMGVVMAAVVLVAGLVHQLAGSLAALG